MKTMIKRSVQLTATSMLLAAGAKAFKLIFNKIQEPDTVVKIDKAIDDKSEKATNATKAKVHRMFDKADEMASKAVRSKDKLKVKAKEEMSA